MLESWVILARVCLWNPHGVYTEVFVNLMVFTILPLQFVLIDRNRCSLPLPLCPSIIAPCFIDINHHVSQSFNITNSRLLQSYQTAAKPPSVSVISSYKPSLHNSQQQLASKNRQWSVQEITQDRRASTRIFCFFTTKMFSFIAGVRYTRWNSVRVSWMQMWGGHQYKTNCRIYYRLTKLN